MVFSKDNKPLQNVNVKKKISKLQIQRKPAKYIIFIKCKDTGQSHVVFKEQMEDVTNVSV